MGDQRILKSLFEFQKRVEDVCKKNNRTINSVKLVAVSKKQPIEKIKTALEAGQLDFGENYVQEALEKINQISNPNVRWHLIGPLQSNKINKIIGKFFLIHSVDSLKLAEELSQKNEKAGLKQSVLLQLNLAEEESKSGFSQTEFLKSWEYLKNLKGLNIQGFMTMPPLGSPEIYFEQLQNLAKEFKLLELSMGTSSDWESAVQNGATYIRIGTAVFGERE